MELFQNLLNQMGYIARGCLKPPMVLHWPPPRLLTHKQNGFTLKTEVREHTVNHFLFVDELKLYENQKHKLYELIDATKAFSDDVGMEFGTDKCKIIHLIRGQLGETEENCTVDQNIIIDNLHSSGFYKPHATKAKPH